MSFTDTQLVFVAEMIFLMTLFAAMATRGVIAKPNIVIILADDMGWEDVGFQGSKDIPTPNLDALAYNGVILHRHYVQPACSPTRGALLTGRYPYKTQMQSGPIHLPEARGLPLNLTLLPELLKPLTYRRHAVGKWHLGFYKKPYLPTRRGFESFFGPYQGYTGYYDYIGQYPSPDGQIYNGYDMRFNEKTQWDYQGTYITDLFTKRATDIIAAHPTHVPLFLYLAYTAPHGSHRDQRVEAPISTVSSMSHIMLPQRRTYAAMVAEMDKGVGKVVEAIYRKGMLHNTIILFFGDNGAPALNAIFPNYASNYPLFGGKYTLYEGGVRTAAFIWSQDLQPNRRVSTDLIHVTDWVPTLYEAAGGNPKNLPPGLDGVSQWATLTKKKPTPRAHAVLNYWSDEKTGSVIAKINGELWKIYKGVVADGKYETVVGNFSSYSIRSVDHVWPVIGSNTNKIIRGVLNKKYINQIRSLTSVYCENQARKLNDCSIHPCLFNLDLDPCEMVDQGRNPKYKDYYEHLNSILQKASKEEVEAPCVCLDPIGSDPRRFNNTWSPWM